MISFKPENKSLHVDFLKKIYFFADLEIDCQTRIYFFPDLEKNIFIHQDNISFEIKTFHAQEWISFVLLGVIFLSYLTFERYILLQHLQMHHQCYKCLNNN